MSGDKSLRDVDNGSYDLSRFGGTGELSRELPGVSESESKRKPWWRREPPPGFRPLALWLIAGIALWAHFTHTEVSFEQGGGPPEPATWWVVGFWLALSAWVTVRWAWRKRHPAEPEPEPAPLPKAQQREVQAKMWRRLIVVMGALWGLVALLASEPAQVKLTLTGLIAAGVVTGLLIVRAVYRRQPTEEEPAVPFDVDLTPAEPGPEWEWPEE